MNVPCHYATLTLNLVLLSVPHTGFLLLRLSRLRCILLPSVLRFFSSSFSRHTDAADSLRKSLELNPQVVDTYCRLSEALHAESDFDGAIEVRMRPPHTGL